MANSPDDYRCYSCSNLVLYRSDHKTDCKFYPGQRPAPQAPPGTILIEDYWRPTS